MSIPILREFFNALGITKAPKLAKTSRAAQYLADGGKLPDSVVENVAKGNAFLSHSAATPKMWAKRMTDLAMYKPDRMKDMG